MQRRVAIAVALYLSVLTTSTTFAADKVKFALDWFPAGYIGFVHVGVKQGYFEAENLDVAIEIARGGSDAVARVATGSVDFGTASLSAMMSAAATGRLAAKAVYSVYSKSPDAFVIKSNSGISSVKDLKGKTIATATYSGSNQVWPLIAKSNGLDPESVTLLKVDFNALGPMLAAGRADAVISWVTSVPLYQTLVTKPDEKLKVIAWPDVGLSGYNWSLIASERMIKSNPDVVRRFVRAFAKSVDYVLANPEEAGKTLQQVASNTTADTNAVEIKAAEPLIKNDISAKYGLGAFNPELVKATWKWVSQAESLPENKIDPATIVDGSFVPK